MNKLMIIGACIWIPIWIFSYTDLARAILNNPENLAIAIVAGIVMIAGAIFMLIGLIKANGKKNTSDGL